MLEHIEQSGVLLLLLGASVLLLIAAHRSRLKRLQAWQVLLAAYFVLLAGWVLEALEGVFGGAALALFEHTCYATSSVLLAVWCWRIFATPREPGHEVGGHN